MGGSYASQSVCPSVCDKKSDQKLINISVNIAPRAMKFGQDMGWNDPKVDLEGQGHRSKVKVTRSKKRPFRLEVNSYLT